MYLGIDLGTSNSAVAGVADGKIRIFKTPEGTDVMPSVIHRDKRGRQTVGVRAYDLAALAPDNAVEGFKRLMGTDTKLRFASTGDALTPEQAATEILRSVVGHALIEAGTDIVTGAVVTVPAAFNQIQSEATLAAAHSAGLDKVALLQEPVAAALASMAGARDRSGLFLVYDLGGGTFDAALVHAIEGEVTVVAHEGVNMLGGRDLDRRIVETIALPWLARNFALPSDFAVAEGYRRLLRTARRAAEVAKIDLSTKERVTISASDEEVRLEDLRGEPIYLDIPITRQDFEELAESLVTRSVECCRKMLADVGYRNEDVARVVLVGGPTKMPMLRRQIQDELGIEVEDIGRVDPMTAVAAGAAIYCEGRDWSSRGNAAKASKRTETAGDATEVAFDYESRTAGDKAKLTARQVSGEGAAEILVESLLGWSSGRRRLSGTISIDLPLREMGPNAFRASVFGPKGLPIQSCCRDIVVDRLIATTGGMPTPHHIALKVLGDDGKDRLDIIVKKGDVLPASGVVRYRLAETMRAGSGSTARIELYQVNNERAAEAHLNLFVGEFRISANDLPASATLRKGDEVTIHWTMLEGQGISVEVELPSVQQRFDNKNFYNWQLARQDFSGEEGASLAGAHLARAEEDIERAEEALPPSHGIQLRELRRRLDEQRAWLRGSLDPDARRQAVEELRLIRQELAIVCQHPDARRYLLRRRLKQQLTFYQRDVRQNSTPEQVVQYDRLAGLIEAALDRGSVDQIIADQIDELRRQYWLQGWDQPRFLVEQFALEKANRHLAADVYKFDESIRQGEQAMEANDIQALRQAYFNIVIHQRNVDGEMLEPRRSALMRL